MDATPLIFLRWGCGTYILLTKMGVVPMSEEDLFTLEDLEKWKISELSVMPQHLILLLMFHKYKKVKFCRQKLQFWWFADRTYVWGVWHPLHPTEGTGPVCRQYTWNNWGSSPLHLQRGELSFHWYKPLPRNMSHDNWRNKCPIIYPNKGHKKETTEEAENHCLINAHEK